MDDSNHLEEKCRPGKTKKTADGIKPPPISSSLTNTPRASRTGLSFGSTASSRLFAADAFGFVFTDAGRDNAGDHINGYGPFTKNSTEIHGNSRTFTPDRVAKVERRIWTQGCDAESNGERADRLGLNKTEMMVAA